MAPIPTRKYRAQNIAHEGLKTWLNENTVWIARVENITIFLPNLQNKSKSIHCWGRNKTVNPVLPLIIMHFVKMGKCIIMLWCCGLIFLINIEEHYFFYAGLFSCVRSRLPPCTCDFNATFVIRSREVCLSPRSGLARIGFHRCVDSDLDTMWEDINTTPDGYRSTPVLSTVSSAGIHR